MTETTPPASGIEWRKGGSQEFVNRYVNPVKWLNLSWLLKGVAMKSILMSVGLATYLLLAAGIVAGELEGHDAKCLHCRLKSAGITTTFASKATQKLMRYHGVKVLKVVDGRSYMLYRGRWEKVPAKRPT